MFILRNYREILHQPLSNDEPVEWIPVMKFQSDDLLQMLKAYRENFNVVRGKEVNYMVKI